MFFEAVVEDVPRQIGRPNRVLVPQKVGDQFLRKSGPNCLIDALFQSILHIWSSCSGYCFEGNLQKLLLEANNKALFLRCLREYFYVGIAGVSYVSEWRVNALFGYADQGEKDFYLDRYHFCFFPHATEISECSWASGDISSRKMASNRHFYFFMERCICNGSFCYRRT